MDFVGAAEKTMAKQVFSIQTPEEMVKIRPEEVDYITKGGIGYLEDRLSTILRDRPKTLLITFGIGRGYAVDVIKQYLEELTRYDFFKHVVFAQREGMFWRYISAGNLLALCISQPNKVQEVIDQGKRGESAEELKSIGVISLSIPEDSSAKEALELMNREGLNSIAVVDSRGIFKGVANKDTIISEIISRMILKQKTS